MRINRIIAKTIPDTRGRQTVETTLFAGDVSATASVPSGKSTGEHEAVELDAVLAIENVNGEMADALVGRDFNSPDELDTFLIELDGTLNKSRLGANAILPVSIAAMRLSALQNDVPLWMAIAKRASGEGFLRVRQVQRSETLSKIILPSEHIPPRLYVNVMNGGVHADFRLPFQEYMLVVGGKTSTALPVAQKVFERLGEVLGLETPMGDEGGYAPAFDTIERPFEILAELVKEFPDTSIAIDVAASQLFHDGVYNVLGKAYSAEELLRVYENLAARFPISSIEDPFDENAHNDFAGLASLIGEKILIVGDDLTCTNPTRIREAVERKEINAVLIKPNQIGTVRETIQAVQATHAAGWKVICSHRSGETDDTFIADFAYGTGSYGIKAGGLAQRERLLKYERLLAIEREAETV